MPLVEGQASPERYAAIRELMYQDEEGTLLEDTLYRNMVLFGVDAVNANRTERSSPVLDAIRDFARGAGRETCLHSLFDRYRCIVHVVSIVHFPKLSDACTHFRNVVHNHE